MHAAAALYHPWILGVKVIRQVIVRGFIASK